MKIPYIKIPITDMAAYLAPCNVQEKGLVFQAVLEFGMYQTWPALSLHPPAQQAYTMVQEIIEKEIKNYKKFCKEQKQKIKNYWQKNQTADDTTVLPDRNNQTKQETKPEANPELKNIYTPIPPGAQPAQGGSTRVFSDREKEHFKHFAGQVVKHFEAALVTEEQKRIWFRRNKRALRDIFDFCGQDETLALRTIRTCAQRLQESGLTGGYQAVCRNLPDYYEQARKELEKEYESPQ